MTLLLCGSAPAGAQLAGSISLDSDQRFRGFSLSGGNPVATATMSYDDPSGAYANAALSTVARHGGPRLLGYQANVGYAQTLNSDLSVEAGVVHSVVNYRAADYGRAGYTEAYVGASARNVAARLSYSPHYYQHGVSTLYGELQATFHPADHWRLSTHAGGLVYLDYAGAPPGLDRSVRYDWQVAASRQLGRVELHSTLSGGGPKAGLYRFGRSGTALTIGATLSL